MNKRVIVAMSGGVDSSTAALLLKNKGYDVIGIFMNFWKDISSDKNYENKCCSLESIQSARNVAQVIKIPFYVVNVQSEFKKKVVDCFLEELKNGNTPNPCVICNKEIKFSILFKKMFEFKADYVATGHYARIKSIKNPSSPKLWQARDKNKDQSYFLYKLSHKELSKILFPLGDYTKPEVRKMAKKFGLPVHDKKESQDICFIPEKGYENFLRKMLKPKKGLIKDLNGTILGKHEGLPFYTIGQRKGIKIGGNGPYYVIKKDFRRNVLVVGGEKDLFNQKIVIKNVNWINGSPKLPSKILLRTRYRNQLVYGIINKNTKCRIPNVRYKIRLDKPQKAVTPGQSAVFYSKDGGTIGGGTID